MMRRRDLIAGLLLGATVGRAQAEQKARLYRIAVVNPAARVADMSETGSISAYRAFFQRLRQLGYVEGQNLLVERFSGEGRTEHFAELAAEVVRSKPDLIFASTSRLTLDLKAATDTIPVVANLADPIAYGIVSSLARPGGNITGTTVDAGLEIAGKRLELLRELVPAASRVSYLASHRAWESGYAAALRETAKRMKISLVGPPMDAPIQEAEYRRVFAVMKQEGADAVIVGDQSEHATNAELIVELAAQVRLPAIYPFRQFADVGGLMVYGVDVADMFRHAADHVDQILRGTKAGEIPFYQPTKFELVINLKTAKALGLTVPDSLLAPADEVIE